MTMLLDRVLPVRTRRLAMKQGEWRMLNTMKRDMVIAALIAVASVTAGILVSFAHPKGIPLIADEPYQTMVPCPVSEGKAIALDAGRAISLKEKISWVDARSKSEFEAWHIPGAIRMTYDYLDPIPDADLKELASEIAAQRTAKVIVYGDDARPSTGELLGKEISERGIRNVYFVTGGAQALKQVHGTGGARP